MTLQDYYRERQARARGLAASFERFLLDPVGPFGQSLEMLVHELSVFVGWCQAVEIEQRAEDEENPF